MASPAASPRGALSAAQELAQAEQFYRQLVAQHPRHAEGWFQLGLIALRQGRFPAAAEALALVTALEPAHVPARHQLAAAYQALGQHDLAAAQYAEVVRQRPECAEAYSDWGVALVRQGQRDAAATAFARAAAIRTDFPEAQNNWGNVLVEQGDLLAALERFRQALVLRSEYPEAHHNLGYALARLGRKEEAVGSFQEAVRLRADYVDAHFRLANLYRDLGRFDDAIASYRATLRHRPAHAEARTQLALTLAHVDRYDEAAACLHQGLLFAPQSADTFNNLGVVLAELDRHDEAAAALRRALELRPGCTEAENNLASVQEQQRRAGQTDTVLDDEQLRVIRRAVHETRELPGDCAELGVYLGGSAKVIAEGGGPVHLFDTFAGMPEDDVFAEGHKAGDFDAALESVQANLAGLPVVFHIGRFPETTEGLEHLRFRFVHVDADLYRSIQAAIEYFWPRLVPGGILLFDDYGWQGCPGVKQALLERFQPEQIEVVGRQALVRNGPRKGGAPRAVDGRDADGVANGSGKPDGADVQNNLGLAHIREGRRDEAAAAFAQAAALRPEFPEAWNNWGNVLVEQGDFAAALEHFQRALSQRPQYAEAHHNLGYALARLGRKEDAVASFTEAVRYRPDYPDAHLHLALLQGELGRVDEAIASYGAVLRYRPEHADARSQLALVLARQGKLDEAAARLHQGLLFQPQSADTYNNLGVVLAQLDRLDEAQAAFEQVLRLRPEYPEAHNNLGHTLLRRQQAAEAIGCFRKALALRPEYAQAQYNLGSALNEQGQQAEAMACFREAVRLQPDYADAHLALGTTLQGQGQLEEAVVCCRKALELRPGYAPALLNLGITLAQLGRFEEAEAAYRDVLERQPGSADGHNSLGVTRLHQGRPADAVGCFDEAIRLKPDAAEMHMNRALTLLSLGQLPRGLEEYEWRWKQKHAMPRPFAQPLWDGSPMPGRTVLLHAEQGLGDSLQFIRYAVLVKQRVGTVLVEVPGPLKNLVASCPGVDAVFDVGAPLPPFDAHVPLMSLPRLFGTTLENIPAAVPYLFSDAGLKQRWRQQLGSGGELKVGIVWQGNPRYGGDRYRSVPLPKFAPLAAVPGVRLFSLQKGTGAEQITALAGAFQITDVGNQLSADFRDAAALIESLDLVIAVDTMIAHLAGALATPVWMLVPFHADWRWLRDREDSQWYPTMRLFRQHRWGDWDNVLGRVAGALRGLVREPRPTTILAATGMAGLLERIASQELDGTDCRREHAELAALRSRVPWSDELMKQAERLSTALASLAQVERSMRESHKGQAGCAADLVTAYLQARDERAAARATIEQILGSARATP